MDLLHSASRLATNTRQKFPLWIILPLVLLDTALTAVIVLKVPYTEIDWRAYMEQVSQYLAGERNYSLIKGGTGPLVYPAFHVYIYTFLHNLTSGGVDIRSAQWAFTGLYIATLVVVLLCYREAKAPVWILPLLSLSKRLHSIYVLRLFNDPVSIFLLFLSILFLQRRFYIPASITYSLSVGVKMNTLLCLPAIGLIYLQSLGRNTALAHAGLMALVQALIAAPFAIHYPKEYLSRAFELTRVFFYKWTVNWRFISEDTFLSKEFAIGLLLLHFTLLAAIGSTLWIRPSELSILRFISKLLISTPAHDSVARRTMQARITPRYILTTILTANTIGTLCARSLHYQFYCWLAWGAPFLLWRSGLGPGWVGGLWAAQEWAWNVFPSTPSSSGVVVGVLAATVAGVVLGTSGKEKEEAVMEDCVG
ncbi:alpha-mannosyltransferase [Ascodesmis nigricans]|uniref:Dol-P-Man:Man(5)GlcNAc(2)-PP-Dol alpha-1,3-mannosyltransferase n=1 Tax=Ascodesmis nigricans TaxID=341454 RepID=A0A4S2N2L6_9PEZI|nr:alpha-mannosyltransferase [Ascodesmis nigricans]